MDKSDKFLNENGKKILKYPGIKKYILEYIYVLQNMDEFDYFLVKNIKN